MSEAHHLWATDGMGVTQAARGHGLWMKAGLLQTSLLVSEVYLCIGMREALEKETTTKVLKITLKAKQFFYKIVFVKNCFNGRHIGLVDLGLFQAWELLIC